MSETWWRSVEDRGRIGREEDDFDNDEDTIRANAFDAL